jgi:hypothetical protein
MRTSNGYNHNRRHNPNGFHSRQYPEWRLGSRGKGPRSHTEGKVQRNEGKQRGLVRLLGLGPGGRFGEVKVQCPACKGWEKLCYMTKDGKHQLVDGTGGQTCHTMICGCVTGVCMPKEHADAIEALLSHPDRDKFFGEGASSLRSTYAMRLFLQKDQPEDKYKKGDQYPQHLSDLVCSTLKLELVSYKVVMNDPGGPYTVHMDLETLHINSVRGSKGSSQSSSSSSSSSRSSYSHRHSSSTTTGTGPTEDGVDPAVAELLLHPSPIRPPSLRDRQGPARLLVVGAAMFGHPQDTARWSGADPNYIGLSATDTRWPVALGSSVCAAAIRRVAGRDKQFRIIVVDTNTTQYIAEHFFVLLGVLHQMLHPGGSLYVPVDTEYCTKKGEWVRKRRISPKDVMLLKGDCMFVLQPQHTVFVDFKKRSSSEPDPLFNRYVLKPRFSLVHGPERRDLVFTNEIRHTGTAKAYLSARQQQVYNATK